MFRVKHLLYLAILFFNEKGKNMKILSKNFKKVCKKNLIVGLTGNIGGGKSEVLRCLKDLGFAIINGDEIVQNEYMKRSDFFSEVVKLFGQNSLNNDGTINKKYIFEKIQTNEFFYLKLNELTKKYIVPKTLEKVRIFKENHRYSVIEIPLLFELQLEEYFDVVLVVCSSKDLAKKRVLENREVDEAYFDFFDSKQMSIYLKIKKADKIIYNNSSLNVLKKKVWNFAVDLKCC